MSHIVDAQGQLFRRDPTRKDELPPALAEALADANAVHHTASGEWRGFATLNYRSNPEAALQQHAFPVAKMAPILLAALHEKRQTYDLYIAQHSYERYERSSSALLWLNLAQIDLDIYNGKWCGIDKDIVCKEIIKRLDQWGIPHPTYIIDSGRGLQIKWIWDTPLSPRALPRWTVAHRWLVQEILAEFDADIKAILPTQIMRVVGSTNLKNGAPVRFRWINGGNLFSLVAVSFNEWANAILPYTREEVQAWRAATAQYRLWDAENQANTQRLLADMPSAGLSKQRQGAWKQIAKAAGIELPLNALASMDDLVAGEIWDRRLNFMKKLMDFRGYKNGVPVGDRNSFIWLAANGLGWINREEKKPLYDDLVAWAKRYVPTMTETEIKQSASAVLKRFDQKQGHGTGLYRIPEDKFLKHLEVTDAEREALSRSSRAHQEQADKWDIGAMGFEKMRGLTFEQYKEETRQRRQKAAERTNAIKSGKNAEKKEKALLMRSNGFTQEEIAKELGISARTVRAWGKANG